MRGLWNESFVEKSSIAISYTVLVPDELDCRQVHNVSWGYGPSNLPNFKAYLWMNGAEFGLPFPFFLDRSWEQGEPRLATRSKSVNFSDIFYVPVEREIGLKLCPKPGKAIRIRPSHSQIRFEVQVVVVIYATETHSRRHLSESSCSCFCSFQTLQDIAMFVE